MKYLLSISIVLCSYLQSIAQHVQFKGNHSMTWSQCIKAYETLDSQSELAKLAVCGTTDIGKPLHLFVINKDGIFFPELFDRNKTILLINNGIHPGEPDGVDASVILCQEMLSPHAKFSALLDSVIICIIPFYNIDGAMIRGKFSRANQNGPDEYGFRGNARNLDLNRDFVKCDSKNAQSFNAIFTKINPHIFIDTHVSDGADYSYTMTLISTQAEKLGNTNGRFLKEKMEPALFEGMKAKNQVMSPYVNTMGRTPDSGLVGFLETPKFATGYAALFNVIGFTTETHMLKPFHERVESTYQFLLTVAEYAHEHNRQIIAARIKSDKELLMQKSFPMAFVLDSTKASQFLFSGYQAKTVPSKVGSGERLFYDHKSGWEKSIPFYNTYKMKSPVVCPDYYIVPQAWSEVIQRLRINGIEMQTLSKDTLIALETDIISKYDSPDVPYEGHFLHYGVEVKKEKQMILLFKGDYVISTKQRGRRYLAECLDPTSEDGFFAWNFFDSVLQQKEWFSDYVFEDIAADLLSKDPVLKSDFELAVKNDPNLKDNHWNQLYWIYKRSSYFEKSVNRYPIYRIYGKMDGLLKVQ